MSTLSGHLTPGSEAWHTQRASGIGGSEVAAILGISPWESPYSLWHRKKYGWTSEGNPATEWGHLMEGPILDWYEQNQTTPGEMRRGIIGMHDYEPWRRVSLDGLWATAGETVVVEAKNSAIGDDWGTPGSDDIPAHYRAQVIWAMDVTETNRADVVACIYGRPPTIYTVHYDKEEARLIRNKARAFWVSLHDDTPPELDGHPATLDAVRRTHPNIDDTTATIPTDIADDWVTAKTQAAQAQHNLRLSNAMMLNAMGRARIGARPDGTRIARRQPGHKGIALHHIKPNPRKATQ